MQKILKNNWLNNLLFFIALLSTVPCTADNRFLFPSDILDQSEQDRNDSERAERYNNQRNWTYPDESMFSNAPSKLRQVQQPLYYSDNFQRETGIKPSYPGDENAYKLKRFSAPEEGRVYGYNLNSFTQRDNLNNTFPNHNLMQRAPLNYPSVPKSFPRNYEALYGKYGEGIRAKHFDENKDYQSFSPKRPRKAANIYSKAYTGDNNLQYRTSQPNLLYPSDVETTPSSSTESVDSLNAGNEPLWPQMRPQNQAYLEIQGRTKENVQVRYIPVPVYSVPGTLPGTVPGVITPSNMVPGYSHLSPNYDLEQVYRTPYRTSQNRILPNRNSLSNSARNNLGLNNNGLGNLMTNQYNPLSSMGLFPGGDTSSFDLFYKNFGNGVQNIGPFTASETVIPGFSTIPDMFSSY